MTIYYGSSSSGASSSGASSSGSDGLTACAGFASAEAAEAAMLAVDGMVLNSALPSPTLPLPPPLTQSISAPLHYAPLCCASVWAGAGFMLP